MLNAFRSVAAEQASPNKNWHFRLTFLIPKGELLYQGGVLARGCISQVWDTVWQPNRARRELQPSLRLEPPVGTNQDVEWRLRGLPASSPSTSG